MELGAIHEGRRGVPNPHPLWNMTSHTPTPCFPGTRSWSLILSMFAMLLKLLVTSATLLVTSALLVVTRTLLGTACSFIFDLYPNLDRPSASTEDLPDRPTTTSGLRHLPSGHQSMHAAAGGPRAALRRRGPSASAFWLWTPEEEV